MVSEQRIELHQNGFLVLGEELQELQAAVNDIFDEYASIDFSNCADFSQKYEDVADLSNEEKREEIRSLLEKYDLENSVSSIVGAKLKLSHIQLRFVATNVKSYMPIHRDVQFYNNKIVGPVPAPYKLIFYPKSIESKDCISVVPKSHRLVFGIKIFDIALNVIINRIKRVSFGAVKAVLFDTTILHHVPTIKNENARARLIITFSP